MQKQATKTRESAKAKAARIAAETLAHAQAVAETTQAERDQHTNKLLKQYASDATAQTLPAITAQPEQAEQAQAEPTKAETIANARKLAAAIFAALSDAVSIPIKSTRAFKLNRDLQPHAIGRKPSPRQAAAIVVALAASKQRIENGATFARTFTMRGESYAIENGCGADMLKAGLVSYDSATESFTVLAASEIRAQLGKALSGFNI